MTYLVQDVASRFNDLVDDISNQGASFARIDSPHNFHSDSLIFVSEADDLPNQGNTPAVIVTSARLASKFECDDVCVITVSNVRLAQALIKQAYNDYDTRDVHWGQIHPSALIHPSAKLADDVRVGPNTVIGPDCIIGAGTHIRTNCVIEHLSLIHI